MSEQAQTGQTVDVVVVGAGFGGLYMVHKLREMGLSVQGVEAGQDVGGTWYWNRYPGARCDVPSLYYSYSWSDELREEWRWTERYAAQPEILAYANHVADRFDLRGAYRFGTRVTRAAFDAASDLWTVETDQGDAVTARYCIMATGCLSSPRAPEIAGAESFKGPIYHTGQWPHEPVDFAGLRVGVVGTGSSGIQSIPVIAETAAHVTVFQRTPNFSVPARNAPISEAERAAFHAAFPEYKRMLTQGMARQNAAAAPVNAESDDVRAEARAAFERAWANGGPMILGSHPLLLRDQSINDIAAEMVRERIREIVADPTIAETLSPHDHPLGTKRICVDTNYYATYNRPNVSLVNLRAAPIEAITETGIRTADAEYELDAIVFATGFDAMTGALLAMDIRGEDDLSLRDEWAAGPRAYLGVAMAGFPNLFIITGPGSPSVLSNVITSCEQHVEWISDLLAHMRRHGLTRAEVQREAQDAWVEHVNEVASHSLFPKAASWYMGANIPGKPRVFMPYIGGDYRQKCEAVVANGYEGFELGVTTAAAAAE